MKVETMSNHDVSSAKSIMWTKEKIAKLIELYKKHESLWNPWHESYKLKIKRDRDIEEICRTLHISKSDFGRKIHNLRNQFNTEMKKLEQRIKVAGESLEELQMHCKWTHFGSLLFLRDVIEPRPGGYQTSQQPPKKMRLRFDSDDDVNVTVIPASAESNINTTEYEHYDEDDTADLATEEYHEYEVTEEDQKYQPINVSLGHAQPTKTFSQVSTSNNRTLNPSAGNLPKTHQTLNCTPLQISRKPSVHNTEVITRNSTHDSSITAVNSNNLRVVAPSSTLSLDKPTTYTDNKVIAIDNSDNTSIANKTNKISSVSLPAERDQWDAFGEMVADEFRNLNSDVSRKKLKRKIMLAMLQVGEEDDAL